MGRGVAIQPCTRQAEAFRMANAVSQGRAASIRTRGRDRAVRAGRALHNGIVRVTAHGLTVSVTPQGGGCHSGVVQRSVPQRAVRLHAGQARPLGGGGRAGRTVPVSCRGHQ
ncbi:MULTISPECIES: aldehyde dehydrogenase family protein [unclassified Streptomyces]|uniref:aldehyde dehydrogenase family protein n=1 Tax=unclassified Streptomyces TaxID=2593676 RepID=UPI0036B6A605